MHPPGCTAFVVFVQASTAMSKIDPQLHRILSQAQALGYLGPGSLKQAVRHAEGFAAGVATPPARFVDLGSGGGLPGLALLRLWPSASAVLIDGSVRRAGFLDDAVATLELGDRVQVVAERAEVAARRTDLRHQCDVVVSRGFGPPAVTAECGSPFLRKGGVLVVSEPPEPTVDTPRWPAEPLGILGLRPETSWSADFHYQSLVQDEECPDRYPRRTGIPTKRPLF